MPETSISFRRASFEEPAPVAPVVPIRPPRQLSPQQIDAREWVRSGSGNAILVAVAGAGKTTTLIEAILPELIGFADYAVYNKKAEVDVQAKLAVVRDRIRCNFQAKTFHAFGFQAWRKCRPDVRIEGYDGGGGRFPTAGYRKFDRICEEIGRVGEFVEPAYRGFVRKLMSLAKQRALGVIGDRFDRNLWTDIVDHFDLEDDLADLNGRFPQGRAAMIERGVSLAMAALDVSNRISGEVVDFDDMIYMPLFADCRMFQVDWLLVDEAQDTNPARRALAQKMVRPGGRTIWVGDPHQAIYGFTGADNDALDVIGREYRCAQLPLTVSFRCPQAVVALAQTWVNHIKAHESAPAGEVRQMQESEFKAFSAFESTDVILCRKNAPLIEVAYDLIRRGIPCYVEGRDIGRGLIELAGKWQVARLDTLETRLRDYRAREISKLMKSGREAMADSLADRVDTLIALIKGLPLGATVNDLRARVETMFHDTNGNQRPCLTLSSVHKSKGREWKRVFLLGRNAYMPSPYARQPWQQAQERNLMYVAVTRAMQSLVEVQVS